jgi:hypothetical protein
MRTFLHNQFARCHVQDDKEFTLPRGLLFTCFVYADRRARISWALAGSVCACEVFIRGTSLSFCIISESDRHSVSLSALRVKQHGNAMSLDDNTTGPQCSIDVPRTAVAFCFANSFFNAECGRFPRNVRRLTGLHCVMSQKINAS